MRFSFIQQLQQLATDRWARQGVRTLLRAATIAASIWCIGLGGHLLWGWPLRTDILGALALATIGVGVLLLLRPRMSAHQAARRLDRRFHLDEQLSTAIEVAAARPPPGSVGARLIAQSDHTARLLSQRIARRQRPPWNDLITLAMLLPLALGLYILAGIGNLDIGASPLPLPPLASPEDPAQQFPEEPPPPEQQPAQAPGGDPAAAGAPSDQPGDQPGGAGSQQGTSGQPGTSTDPRTLEALADALRDQGATRPAAEALDRGDLGGAAQRLRELADQADQLSQDARNDMADSLNDAAQRIEGNDPALADQLRRSAEGLEQGGQQAAQALDDLARAIEGLQDGQQTAGGSQDQPGQDGQSGQQAGQDGQDGQGDQPGGEGGQDGQGGDGGQAGGPGGAGNGAGEQRQAEPSRRLGVPGQPVPLEADGPGQVPAEPSDRPPTSSEVVPGTTSGGGNSDRRVQAGDDPLRVPLDERNVVQDYFQN
jgi:hypothetical protein